MNGCLPLRQLLLQAESFLLTLLYLHLQQFQFLFVEGEKDQLGRRPRTHISLATHIPEALSSASRPRRPHGHNGKVYIFPPPGYTQLGAARVFSEYPAMKLDSIVSCEASDTFIMFFTFFSLCSALARVSDLSVRV